MKKKFLVIVFVVCMAVLIFPNLPTRAAQGKNPDELVQQINATAASVKAKTGVYDLNGWCGLYVGWQLEVLGINNSYVPGDGNRQYDNYVGLSKTSNGYKVSSYQVNDFGKLKNVLMNIANSDEPYNILVGFERTSTSAGQVYGHAFFIHGIVNGTVYYSESFNATVGGVYYPASTPIACSIDTLCGYYGSWATGIEGVIHFTTGKADNNSSSSSNTTFDCKVITDTFAEFINVESGKMLNVYANSSQSEAAINLWERDWTSGEQWKIVMGTSGYYLVPQCAEATGKALNVYGDTASIGTKICLWDITNHPTQAWIMEGQQDGSVIIRSVSDPNCCLAESGPSNGDAITLKAYSTTDASIRWKSDLICIKESKTDISSDITKEETGNSYDNVNDNSNSSKNLICLDDEISFDLGSDGKVYSFMLEKSGLINFNIKSNKSSIRVYLYDSNGKSITNYYTEMEPVKGRAYYNGKDYFILNWNSDIKKLESDICFELQEGLYYVKLELDISLGSSPIGSPETSISTSFKTVDDRDKIGVNDSIICYPTSRTKKEYNLSVTKKGILTFKVNAIQSETYFYLYDSKGKYITDRYIDREAEKGSMYLNGADYCIFRWNKDIKQSQGIIAYELDPGDYRVVLKGSTSNSPETILSTSFKSKEIKINKSRYKLKVGKSFTVKISNAQKDTKVKWYSSKKSVATVNKTTGKVKAKKAGKTTIYAKIDGKKYKCMVTVVN